MDVSGKYTIHIVYTSRDSRALDNFGFFRINKYVDA